MTGLDKLMCSRDKMPVKLVISQPLLHNQGAACRRNQDAPLGLYDEMERSSIDLHRAE
mgnify:CR=1 FL=1